MVRRNSCIIQPSSCRPKFRPQVQARLMVDYVSKEVGWGGRGEDGSGSKKACERESKCKK
jgi:hypothetical protein